jgi:invasion protein IalB
MPVTMSLLVLATMAAGLAAAVSGQALPNAQVPKPYREATMSCCETKKNTQRVCSYCKAMAVCTLISGKRFCR